jgi:hypothetical protein
MAGDSGSRPRTPRDRLISSLNVDLKLSTSNEVFEAFDVTAGSCGVVVVVVDDLGVAVVGDGDGVAVSSEDSVVVPAPPDSV